MKLLKATILLVCFQEAFASDSAPLNKLKQDVNDQHRKLISTKSLKKPCKVIKVEYLRIDISGSERSEASGDGDYVCEVDESDADGISGTRIKMDLSDVQRATMNNAMEKGSLVSGRSTYFTKDITFTSEGILNVPQYDSMVSSHFQRSRSDTTRNLQNDPIHVGNKPILAVRVTANDYYVLAYPDTISDKIFGTNGDDANLASQMFACSGGQLTIISDYDEDINDKLSAPGVLEVSIDMFLDGSSDMAIENAITTAVQLKLGFGLPGPFEQVMYIKYACFPTSCTYAAYAYINDWMSMYQGAYYKYPGVQMHEIGHNLGLAHSGMGEGSYDDHTCLMGNPLYSDDDVSMCFNPAKSWQLGWYSPFYEDVYVGAGQEWEGKLIGVSDYNNNTNSDKIVLRIETDTQYDYFVGFNRATGSNSDNDLCDNCVTVIKTGNNGESYSQSWNQINPQGGLLENEFFLIENHLNSGKTLRIHVIQINLDVSPGFAHVSIKFDEFDCPESTSAIKFELMTDNYPENAWSMKNSEGVIVHERAIDIYSTPNKLYSENYCVSPGEYEFVITDVYGDGICCDWGNGYYTMYEGSTLLFDGGQFTYNAPESFTVQGASGEVFATVQDHIGWIDAPIESLNGAGVAPRSVSPATASPATISSCPESESLIRFELRTDEYAPESAWSVENSVGLKVLERVRDRYPSANNLYSENFCFTPGEYEFIITDSYGDGICCLYGIGYYRMYEGSTLLFEGGQFFASASESFTVQGAISCPGSESAIKFELMTDEYANENAWSMTNSEGVIVHQRASDNYPATNFFYSENYCVTPGEYEFEISDVWGDGICCEFGNGYYKMYEGSTLLFEGGQFAGSASESFTVG